MGSTMSRNIRDLFEVAGCDGIPPLENSTREEPNPNSTSRTDGSSHPNPRPCTPVPHHRTRLLGQDPRSPSVGIVRTPIEVMATPVSDKSSNGIKLEMSNNGGERHYLETDIDFPYDAKESAPCTPVGGFAKVGQLPPGLSASHLLKLKFLGMDPRSPSEGIVRTPILVRENVGDIPIEESIENRAGDTSSICSSRSLFDCSDDYLDISKACTEPSAVLSDYEITKDWDISLGLSDHEEEEKSSSVSNRDVSSEPKEEINEDFSKEAGNSESLSGQELTMSKLTDITTLKEKLQPAAALSKPAAGVIIFRDETTKTPQNTPKKKSTRTPLTPICNLTPNDVRNKKTQGKRLDKDKLVCKIFSGNENTPTKQSAGFVKKEKKTFQDENSKLVEWDHDTTIII